jgi:TolB-like protein
MLIAVKVRATMLVSLKSFLSLHSFLSYNSINPINPMNPIKSINSKNPMNSKNSKNCVNFLLLALCLLLIFIYGCGGPKYHIRSKADISAIKRVAVLPLENFTADTYAGEKIRRLVISELLSRGIDVIEPGEVTRLLKESDVRSLGSIKVSDIQNTGKTLGVEAVMLGSVEAFGMGRGISVTYPEVSIHLMLLEASSGNILWSGLHTTGGASFWTRHFGAEGISLSEAARKAVKEAVSTLF